MHMLKNKHVILAMVVAPILAIIAYFSVDYVVSEKPRAAAQGNSYKLAAKSNCRYQSGVCTLENGDIEVSVHARHVSDKKVELKLHSGLPIQQAVISHVSTERASEPVKMNVVSDEMKDWQVTLELGDPTQTSLRLALNIYDSMYYAEVTAVFIDYETSFSRDNFSE